MVSDAPVEEKIVGASVEGLAVVPVGRRVNGSGQVVQRRRVPARLMARKVRQAAVQLKGSPREQWRV